MPPPPKRTRRVFCPFLPRLEVLLPSQPTREVLFCSIKTIPITLLNTPCKELTNSTGQRHRQRQRYLRQLFRHSALQSKITFAILRAVTAKGCWFTDSFLLVLLLLVDLERVIPRTSSALQTSRPWGGLEDAPPSRHLGETRTNYILFDLWQTKAPNQFRRNLAQSGSASALGAEGREFESPSSDFICQ